MFVCFVKWSSVINLDLFWKQVFSYIVPDIESASARHRICQCNTNIKSSDRHMWWTLLLYKIGAMVVPLKMKTLSLYHWVNYTLKFNFHLQRLLSIPDIESSSAAVSSAACMWRAQSLHKVGAMVVPLKMKTLHLYHWVKYYSKFNFYLQRLLSVPDIESSSARQTFRALPDVCEEHYHCTR